MTAANWDSCYRRERVYEGGNDDDPTDHGGRTSRGITQSEYDAFRRGRGLGKRDVWLADEDEIAAIYREQYWNVLRCDEMPAGIDLVLFDGGVNSGPGQAVKWLQRALAAKGLYDGAIDGGIGLKTLRGVNSAPDNDLVIADMMDRRQAFLEAIIARDPSQHKYEGGWLARVANVTKAAEAMATGSIGPDPVVLPESPKAAAAAVKDPKVSAETATVVTVGAAAVTAANEITGAQVPEAAAASGSLRWLLLIGIVVAIGFAVWALLLRKRKDTVLSAAAKSPVNRKADADLETVALADALPKPAAADPADVAIAEAVAAAPATT